MNIETIIHASEFENSIDYIRDAVGEGLSGKLEAHIKKHAKEDDVVRVELTLTRTKIGSTGKLEISFPGYSVRSIREDFIKLDDLIKHLFDHVDDQMGKSDR